MLKQAPAGSEVDTPKRLEVIGYGRRMRSDGLPSWVARVKCCGVI